MTSGKWKDLRRVFKQYDHSNQGYLSVQEFRSVLKLCNIALDENDMYRALSELDKTLEGKNSIQ